MPAPKISVVVITRNRLAYLRECVESVLLQDYPAFELLIGDNGSTDGTVEYLRELTGRDNRVMALFNGRNLGSCEGRNLLLQRAAGDLWFIIDDDAAFQFRDDLLKVVSVFEKHTRAGAIGFTVVNADDPKTLNLWMYQANPDRARNTEFRSAQFASCAVCFRREAMEVSKFAPGEYFVNSFFYSWDEFPIAWRLLETGWECWYSPLVAIRHYGSSTIDVPTAHRVRLDAKSIGQFAGLILPFPHGWWRYVVRLSLWMLKRATRTHTLKACLTGFLEGIPAFFSERRKRIKVRASTVRGFIRLVEAEKIITNYE
ncbi:MAG: glycosyltransferase [Bacteroidota bacterium]|nr:glycosyltransferase [Bacteroidota bacterium]MDP4233451.1 glycosyltransferase [Bacteroidota bacterium]MDP4242317.1 glycosyltransferase [Bacteroidota bacterium]MDP4287073.1 glycosyltransferase [Bacteroidota bacterium]